MVEPQPYPIAASCLPVARLSWAGAVLGLLSSELVDLVLCRPGTSKIQSPGEGWSQQLKTKNCLFVIAQIVLYGKKPSKSEAHVYSSSLLNLSRWLTKQRVRKMERSWVAACGCCSSPSPWCISWVDFICDIPRCAQHTRRHSFPASVLTTTLGSLRPCRRPP